MARVEGRPVQGNGWRPEHAARRFTRVTQGACSLLLCPAGALLAMGHAPPDGASGDREREDGRWRWPVRHLTASPQARATYSAARATATSASRAATRPTRSGSPRAAAGQQSSLIKHAPSQRSPTDCLTPRLPSKRDASAFDEQERAARGAKAAWTRHSHVSVARGALGLSTSSLLSKARLVLSHAFDRALYMQRRSARWLLCTL